MTLTDEPIGECDDCGKEIRCMDDLGYMGSECPECHAFMTMDTYCVECYAKRTEKKDE